MKIIVKSGGRSIGPFSLEQLRKFLIDGKVKEDDLAWSNKLDDWMTVGAVLDMSKMRPSLPAAGSGPVPVDGRTKYLFINSDGRNYGPYPADQVQKFLRDGRFQQNDFAWCDEANEWIPVSRALTKWTTPVVAVRPQDELIRARTVGRDNKRPKKKVRFLIVNSEGQRRGPFTLMQAVNLLKAGKLKVSDPTWCDNSSEWTSLGDVLDQARVPVRPNLAGSSLTQAQNVDGRISADGPSRVSVGLSHRLVSDGLWSNSAMKKKLPL